MCHLFYSDSESSSSSTFFGKIDNDNLLETSSHASAPSAASATYEATKEIKLDDADVDTTNFQSVYPTFSKEKPGTPDSFELHALFLFSNNFILHLSFFVISGISAGMIPKHQAQGDGHRLYKCTWTRCTEEDQSRTNICMHLCHDHLNVVLHCTICDHPIFSWTALKSLIEPIYC